MNAKQLYAAKMNAIEEKDKSRMTISADTIRFVTIDETNNSGVMTTDNKLIGTVFEGTDSRYQYLSTDWTTFANFDGPPLLSEIAALYC